MFNLYDLSKCSPSVQEYGDWNWSRRPKEFPSLSDTHPFPRWIPAPASSSTAQPASPQLAQENFSRPFLPLPLSQHWSSPSRYGSSLQPPVIPATQCSRPAHIPAHQTRMGYTPTRATQVLSQGTYFWEKQKSRKDTAFFCLAMSVCLSVPLSQLTPSGFMLERKLSDDHMRTSKNSPFPGRPSSTAGRLDSLTVTSWRTLH